jgi:hypothetical protein
MNALLTITLFGLLISPCLNAQNSGKEPGADSVLEAIQQFKSQRSGKPNEVTVILDPPMESSSPKSEKQKNIDPPPKKSDSPVMVTGTPPVGSELVPDKAVEAAKNPAPASEETPSVNSGKPREGLSVHVEKLKSGRGSIDPTKVKLLAPFPAKPLAPAPPGWLLQSAENVPPFTREIELSDGKKITLSIRPHLLVPSIDGTTVFSVLEPGFDPSLAYQQNATVGAILSNSIIQLENDSKQMGIAIDKIQQILTSLPKSEITAPPSDPEPVKSTPKRKR